MHRITLELKERLLRCEKLQSKFAVLQAKQRGSEDDGEERSQVGQAGSPQKSHCWQGVTGHRNMSR